MANFLGSLWDSAMVPVNSAVDATKDLFKGDTKGALGNIKHLPGDSERANSKLLNSMGVRGWVGDHPNETAAAVIAATLGGPALLGGSAGAGGTGASTVGGTGMSAYLGPSVGSGAPTTAFPGLLNAGTASSTQAASMAPAASFASPQAAYAAGQSQGLGATNAILNAGNAGVGNPLSTGGASKFTPAMLQRSGAEAAANAGPGMQSVSPEGFGNLPKEAEESGKPFNYELLMKTLQSVVPNEQKAPAGMPVSGGGVRTGFNFDRKIYENPLLTRAYGELYMNPTSYK
ncbi:hypothetical protein HWB19_gp090 [Cronobacter phage vB_CsaP_009]|uniref:Uncharacterized protein n=1 Tax=Cronobacter phage vB_CsaP_009 TaxID=2699738 RepID=A0A679FDZ6_9CAUD|nr:hypothetical protein HWB19_gp090 [Cronobacter phage vB_CsaP_009]BBU72736.1 hypothetical protein [Cronobacter phage vB_CsaP_009]